MKRAILIVVALGLGLSAVAALNGCQPNKMTPERIAAARKVEMDLAEAERKEKQMAQERDNADALKGDTMSDNSNENVEPLERAAAPEGYDGETGPDNATLTAPDSFKAQFICSNGNFVVECHRDWAPNGADRFYNLIVQGFYNDQRFFRVVPGFVVQFGIHGDPMTSMKWRDANLTDDPVVKGNQKGRLVYAMRGPNTRTTQLFINLGDNSAGLDPQGFAAFGEIIQGMSVVEGITSEYGESPDQGLIQMRGNDYLERSFPNMDYIKEAYIAK